MASKKRKGRHDDLEEDDYEYIDDERRKQTLADDNVLSSGLNNTRVGKFPDRFARGKALKEGLVTLGNHVEQMTSEGGMTEEDKNLLWLYISSYWPCSVETDRLRRIYNHVIPKLKEEAGKFSDNVKPKPFLETGFGGLAPELREMIFVNLLDPAPPFGGQSLRVEQTHLIGQSPTSLAGFVDLKASCLTVLQTCRQIYSEAFPIFYANGSYYLSTAQDLASLTKMARSLRLLPQRFRVDTVTSLCLKNLLINMPRWSPRTIDFLISIHSSYNREELEAERADRLDPKLVPVDLGEMKGLRKICLCMCVGQEWEYLKFLFNLRGLGRGVIEFVDDFRWSIRSQSILGNDWKLQYISLSTLFSRRGKDFEMLDYEAVKIQGEVLNIDSRASDLDEGDERWVEVDIGARDYEERMLGLQHTRNAMPIQSSHSQQGLPFGAELNPPEADRSDHGSEHLQGQINGQENGTRSENELDWDSDDVQDLPHEGDDDLQTGHEQDQESEDLQAQSPGDTHSANTNQNEEPQEGSSYSQYLIDGDNNNAQAVTDTFQEFETSQESLDEDRAVALSETTPVDEPTGLQDSRNTEDRYTMIATKTNQRLEVSMGPIASNTACVQPETNLAQRPADVPESGQKDDLEAQRGEEAATAELSLMLQQQSDQDAQNSIGAVGPGYFNAETQTECSDVVKDLQRGSQTATDSTKKVLTLDQDPMHQPKSHDKQQLPALPNLESSPKKIAKPLQKSSSLPTQQQSTVAIAAVDHSSNQPPKHQTPLTSHKKPIILHGCVRAAALVLALYLFGVGLYASLENTLGQLLALLLFILLSFVALWSESG